MKKIIQYYLTYYKFIKGYRIAHALSLIFTILLVSVESIGFFFTKNIIDDIAKGNSDIFLQLVFLAILVFLPILLQPGAFYSKQKPYVKGVTALLNKLYGRIISQDLAYHTNKSSGALITKIIQSPQFIYTFIWDIELFTLTSVGAIIVPIILLGTLHHYIAITIIITSLISIPFLIFIMKVNIQKRAILKDRQHERNTAIVDGITNFETVRSFGNEQYEKSMLNRINLKTEIARMDFQTSFRWLDFAIQFSSFIIFSLSIYVSWRLFEVDLITTGALIVVIGYLYQYTSKLFGAFFSFRNLLKQLPVMDDTFELLNLESTIVETQNPKTIIKPYGEIEVKDTKFTYEKKQKSIINNLSLKIGSKQTVAFVGPSGGGKTTLIKLLMRYYDTNSGSILIDGVNIKDLTYKDLRNLFGLVPQEPVLFNRTIFENVAYALNLQSKEDYEAARPIVEEACKNAEIHDFIMTLPKKYKTKVGERGVKLSGGQKQRIAISRVILKDPQIVIFDEATSMLDSESEQAIQKAFTKLSKDKTTIVIAHRLSTITHADKIFVIDQGKITEEGSHSELLSLNGEYAKLWNIQSGGFVKG